LGGLQPWHWVIVIALFVLLFGAKKLPDAARSLGKSMRIFKSEIKEMQADSKPEAEAQAPLPDVAGRTAPSATPIASERVDTSGPAPAAERPSDQRPA
jgi:sec-independent protein translocase protein TatA